MTRRLNLSRRSFLRGVIGGSTVGLALPALEAMFNDSGNLYANGAAIPKRFGVFFWGNGIKRDRWIPSNSGQGGSWSLSPSLMPLAAHKEYLSLVTGHNVKTRNLRGHHAGTVGILSGTELEPRDPMGAGYASTFKTQSIDQFIADRIGSATTYKSIEVGVDERVSKSEGTTLHYLSHNGPDSFNPQEYDPAKVFNRLFGPHFNEPGDVIDVDPELAVRRYILDAVLEDARALSRKLGNTDRARLEQHMDNIDNIHRRLQAMEDATPPTSNTCSRPMTPNDEGTRTAEFQQRRSRLMADLLVMTTACDLTRVWSNIFSGSVSGTAIWDVDSTSIHSLTHDEGGNQPKVQQIVEFIMGEFGYILQRLKETSEGDGNLLDHHVILATSDLSDGKRHDLGDYPILIAGKGGGSLKGDYHYRQTGANASNALLTILRAMGINETSYGAQGGYTNTFIPDLLV